jgi:hypothetical protein
LTRALLLAALLVGCKSATPQPMTDRAATGVERSISRAHRAAGKVGPVELAVRFNPARCSCPDFEVYAYDGWVRAFIEHAPQVDTLRGGDPLAQVSVVGQFEDDVRRAPNGVAYPVLVCSVEAGAK